MLPSTPFQAQHMLLLLCFSLVPACDRRSALATVIGMRELQRMKDDLAKSIDDTRRLEDNIAATVQLFPDAGRTQFSVDDARLAAVGARRRDDEWKWNVLTDLEYAMGECVTQR